VFVRITVHYPARGISSTIAIALALDTYTMFIYKGAKNKIAVLKKMIVSVLFVLTF